MADANANEDSLTPEAKRAIRLYMATVKDDDVLSEAGKRAINAYIIRYITPSAVGLSIVSAIVGYVANGLGQAEATKNSFDKIAAPVIASATNVAKAEATAQALSKDVDKLLTEAKVAAEKAEKSSSDAAAAVEQGRASAKIVEQIRTDTEAKQREIENLRSLDYDKVASALLKQPALSDSLSRLTSQQYSTLDKQISDLRAALAAGSSDVKTVDGRIMRCPDGYYVVGWTFQDQPGLGHGALWGPSAACARVNLPPPP